MIRGRFAALVAALAACLALAPAAQDSRLPLPAFPLRSGGLELHRPSHPGSFYDVAGRRSALFGYENRDAEAWIYPLEILKDLSLSFKVAGSPMEMDGRAIMASIDVRPEATTLVYAHAAFTVREIVFAPIDEPGIVILLDVHNELPVEIGVSFRPRLRLMWPAPSASSSIGWDREKHRYAITEDTGRFAGVIGCPIGRDKSVMPYQEEPRDAPNTFTMLADNPDGYIPIVITGSTEGLAPATAAYDRILGSIHALYERTWDHYTRLDGDTLSIATPDPRLDAAFRWAKAGIDKGVATNPSLGTGLLAGFRTAGDSERPGFAWFFGRDALWTALATTAEGAFETTRTALEFLRKYQRADGKIPHELSQSAPFVKWFDDYPYAWASADATPLYVIAHVDYWRATGDRAFLDAAWPSILKAYRFSAATDTDRNGLIENTNVGHGWVEGGDLYPPHEEIYMQGLWIAASRGMSELAMAMHDQDTAATAQAAAERTRVAMEQIYWLPNGGFYAFATANHFDKGWNSAEAGPRRERREARLHSLSGRPLIDEDTVLPAVPLWFGTVDAERAQDEIDHLAAGSMATDWGSRILSDRSGLYDPLSYHHGSVWPLFTGWASVAAYRYGRPDAGYGALMSNAFLTWRDALGSVTELMSGAYATSFGRSSRHQVWSEAMVVSPVVRGLLGLEEADGGRTLRFAPMIPPSWKTIAIRNIPLGTAKYDITYERSAGRALAHIVRHPSTTVDPQRVIIAPAFPLDARVRNSTINGAAAHLDVTRIGDVQHAEVAVAPGSAAVDVVFTVDDEGTAIETDLVEPAEGAMNEGLRVLRSHADASTLHLTLEGVAGHTYTIRVYSRKRLGAPGGVKLLPGTASGVQLVEVTFGRALDWQSPYVRREISLALGANR